VFANRVLRRIFVPKRDEMVGGWKKILNSELHNLYSLRNAIRKIRSRRVRWAGHVAPHRREDEFMLDFEGKARRKETTREAWLRIRTSGRLL
jgi:hypothetical protein